jgi:hypothetical protein
VESKPAFNLFTQDQRGQKWRGVFDSIEEATRVAQQIANRGYRECFVYDAKTRKEIGRHFSQAGRAQKGVKIAGDGGGPSLGVGATHRFRHPQLAPARSDMSAQPSLPSLVLARISQRQQIDEYLPLATEH